MYSLIIHASLPTNLRCRSSSQCLHVSHIYLYPVGHQAVNFTKISASSSTAGLTWSAMFRYIISRPCPMKLMAHIIVLGAPEPLTRSKWAQHWSSISLQQYLTQNWFLYPSSTFDHDIIMLSYPYSHLEHTRRAPTHRPAKNGPGISPNSQIFNTNASCTTFDLHLVVLLVPPLYSSFHIQPTLATSPEGPTHGPPQRARNHSQITAFPQNWKWNQIWPMFIVFFPGVHAL